MSRSWRQGGHGSAAIVYNWKTSCLDVLFDVYYLDASTLDLKCVPLLGMHKTWRPHSSGSSAWAALVCMWLPCLHAAEPTAACSSIKEIVLTVLSGHIQSHDWHLVDLSALACPNITSSCYMCHLCMGHFSRYYAQNAMECGAHST